LNVIVGAAVDEKLTVQLPATGLPLGSVKPWSVIVPLEPLRGAVKENVRLPTVHVASTVQLVCARLQSIAPETGTALEHADELEGSSVTT